MRPSPLERLLLVVVLALGPGCVGTAELIEMETGLGVHDGGPGSPSGSLEPSADAGTAPLPSSPDAGSPAKPPTGDAGTLDAGTPLTGCAALSCPANARCDGTPAKCHCLPGFVSSNGQCLPVSPGTPAQRTQAEVCQAWTDGQVQNAPGGGFSASTTSCDPGTLSRAGLDDTLRRLNMHRWLAGLGPTEDSASDNDAAQNCAMVAAWNPAGQQAHFPSPSATCYTQAGASGASSSNIAWGCYSGPNAIDQWMIDHGNATTYGHRRWLLNPPLSPVGIGLYQGGNNYGSASCIRVFSSGGTGPDPGTIAYPPPGFVPVSIASWPWTVQGSLPAGTLSATVVRQSDGQSLPVTVEPLIGNYGFSSAVAIVRSGWDPVAGQTYGVTLVGSTGGAYVYEVKPVTCP